MATTIKRTTISHTRPARTDAPPPLPETPARGLGGIGGRTPEMEQPIYHPDEIPPPETETPDEPETGEPQTVVTVGEEQLQRSLEMQAMGIEAWKAAHDERNPEDAQQSVEGVGWRENGGRG